MQSPEPSSAAVVIQTFHVGTALIGIRRRAGNFRQQLFGFRVSVEQTVLSTLFVIENKVERYLGTVGPQGLGRGRSISDNVAYVAGGTATVVALVNACAEDTTLPYADAADVCVGNS